MLSRQAVALTNSLTTALKTSDDRHFQHLGVFAATIMVLQDVFRRPEWGFSEYPDVMVALHEHSGDRLFDAALRDLTAEFSRIGFRPPPLFRGGLPVETLVTILRDTLHAAETVRRDIQLLRSKGDKVLSLMHAFETTGDRQVSSCGEKQQCP